MKRPDIEASRSLTYGGFPKIRAAILGVPIIGIIAFGGLFWGPPILGELPFSFAGGQLPGGYPYMRLI